MHHGDRKIRKKDVEQIEREINKVGLTGFVVKLFDEEPQLAEMMCSSWDIIHEMLDELGLPWSQRRAFQRQITNHTMKSLILLDRAHRRLLTDLLPEEPSIEDGHAC